MIHGVAAISSYIVGIVLFAAGLSKAMSPHDLVDDLRTLLRVLSKTALLYVGAALITLEIFLGVNLLSDPGVLIIALLSAALLFVFALVNAGRAKKGERPPCGCFGRIVRLGPEVSFFVNVICFILVVISLYGTVRTDQVLPETNIVVVAGTLSAVAAILYARRYRYQAVRAGLDSKSNDVWNAFLKTHSATPTQLVVFLHPTCLTCKRWIATLNRIHVSSGTPPVLGVLATDGDLNDSFVMDNGIQFPIINTPLKALQHLSIKFPTAMLVKDGMVKSVQTGTLPSELLTMLPSDVRQS